MTDQASPAPTGSTLAHDLPGCLYLATARPPAPTPPLRGAIRTAVVVIGGGYTGLSAALHLAERGVDTVLLESAEPGWGAAGRNGGQVNAGLKHEPAAVETALGPVAADRLVRLAGDAPDALFRLIDRIGIECEAERGGTLRTAYSGSQRAALARSAADWRARGVELALLDEAAIAKLLGTSRYVAGLLDPRGGSINPLSFARGLAAAALRAGARVFGSSRALSIEPADGGWSVRTAAGSVHADRLALATDGYTDDLWPGLRTSIVPIFSGIVASEPLPPALLADVMATRAVVYEIGSVTAYYRRDRTGRILMGGRGVQRPAATLADYEHLVRYARRLWPALGGIRWTHCWNGQFALTPDFYPHFHAPAANVYAALGYSGRGVALGTAMGRELAAAAAGEPLEELAVPVTPIRRIPLHHFWRAGVAARIAGGRLLDALGR